VERQTLHIPRWVQLVALPIGLLLAWSIAGLVRETIVIFLVSALFALLLNPLVFRVSRVMPRGLAILTVLLVVFAIIVGALALIGAELVTQVSRAATAVENEVTVDKATGRTPADAKIDDLQAWLNRHGLSHVQVRHVGDTAIARIQKQGVFGYVRKAVDVGQTVATEIVTGVFRTILVLVVTIYMLLAGPRVSRALDNYLPPGPDGRGLGWQAQHALMSYVRGQFFVSLIIGVSTGVVMELYGITGIWPAARDYSLFLGLFSMLTEAIPYVGPVIGAIPAVVLAAFDSPLTALWVTLAYIGIHQLEGHVVVPRVMGAAIRSHPLAVIFCLLAGAEIAGIFGAILAIPLLAVSTAIITYIRQRVVLEPWPRYALAEVGAGVAETSQAPPGTGAPRPSDSAS
jgi:predicted PurR-regulated permease PerM